jgi:hypothetical protein
MNFYGSYQRPLQRGKADVVLPAAGECVEVSLGDLQNKTLLKRVW